MNITEATVPLVAKAIRTRLEQLDGKLTGISCIARGADSVFAGTVLELGGDLEVVVPSTDYRRSKVKPDHAPLFDALITRAAKVTTLPFATTNHVAYVAANETMLDAGDEVLAVWNGVPSPDRGGTAGVVADARARGLPVTIIWPSGAARAQSCRRTDPSQFGICWPTSGTSVIPFWGGSDQTKARRVFMSRSAIRARLSAPGGSRCLRRRDPPGTAFGRPIRSGHAGGPTAACSSFRKL